MFNHQENMIKEETLALPETTYTIEQTYPKSM